MKPIIFIHTNAKQMLGAKVAAYTMRRNSASPDAFDIRFINLDDFPRLKNKQGKTYLRKGMPDVWDNNDLQSFTPLRFLPPQLMNYKGIAVLTDPDVFAIGDVMELINRPMNGKAILCRKILDKKFSRGYYFGTSVMLLDCAKLTHWNWDKNIEDLFAQKVDYRDWMSLFLEEESIIGEIEEYWNSFDHLDENTKLLHNTGRLTQPWRTGLPLDFSSAEKKYTSPKKTLGDKILLTLGIRKPTPVVHKTDVGLYRAHPDINQERFFFNMLAECLQQGIITHDELKSAMRSNDVRHDALEVLSRYAA